MLAECECSREGKRRRAPSPSSILRLRRRRILQHVMKTGDWGDGTSPSTTGFMFVAAILLFVKLRTNAGLSQRPTDAWAAPPTRGKLSALVLWLRSDAGGKPMSTASGASSSRCLAAQRRGHPLRARSAPAKSIASNSSHGASTTSADSSPGSCLVFREVRS